MKTPPLPPRRWIAGLLGSTNSNPIPANAPFNAQFNAVQSDASGNLYLLLDQKDGVRLLKTDASATNILAETQLGTTGDIGVAMALDPSGNIYIAGTTTSGALAATSSAAFPSSTGTSTNAFIGKFDQNLNPVFVTYAGSGGLAVSAIAATADAVFLTGLQILPNQASYGPTPDATLGGTRDSPSTTSPSPPANQPFGVAVAVAVAFLVVIPVGDLLL
jgi:trimeric autotransporter adhesin